MASVLVIDDNDELRSIMKVALEEAGHRVSEAPNGIEGIRVYRHQPADLVITDLIMPEKEGLEIIRQLRRESASVKIIAVSGGSRKLPMDFLPIAKRLGADEALRKPFDTTALLALVDRVLAQK